MNHGNHTKQKLRPKLRNVKLHKLGFYEGTWYLTFGEHGVLTFGEHGDLTRENADLTSNYRENGDLIRDFIGWNGDAAW